MQISLVVINVSYRQYVTDPLTPKRYENKEIGNQLTLPWTNLYTAPLPLPTKKPGLHIFHQTQVKNLAFSVTESTSLLVETWLIWSVCHSSSSFRYMLSLLVNKQCHQVRKGFIAFLLDDIAWQQAMSSSKKGLYHFLTWWHYLLTSNVIK